MGLLQSPSWAGQLGKWHMDLNIVTVTGCIELTYASVEDDVWLVLTLWCLLQ